MSGLDFCAGRIIFKVHVIDDLWSVKSFGPTMKTIWFYVGAPLTLNIQ